MKSTGTTFASSIRTWVFTALGIAAVSSLVTCTISNDNGNPALPGQYNPTGPGGSGGGGLLNNPAFIVSSAHDILPGDTLTLSVLLIQEDMNNNDSAVPVPREAVVDSVLPKSGSWTVSTGRGDTLWTDANGMITFQYTDTAVGARTVVFRCGSLRAVVKFNVTQTPTTVEKLLTVRADKSVLTADGVSTTTIYARVMNAQHNPVVGVQIGFIATAGTIKGNAPPSASQSGISVTDEDGIATATLTSTNINDTCYITVYLISDLTLNDQTQVAFLGVHIGLAIDTTNLRVGQTQNLTATLLNGANAPIARAPIYFVLGKGANSNLQIVLHDTVTGFDGTALAVLKGQSSGSDSVIVAGGGARAVLLLNVTNLKLTATLDQTQMVANDTGGTMLHIMFTDANNAPENNKLVRVVRTRPSATGAQLTDTLPLSFTNAQGADSMKIAALPYDGTVSLTVTAYADTATHDLATAQASARFTITRNLTISALPTVVQADGTSSSQITVTIKTPQGTAMVGDTVEFSTTAGVIDAVGITDSRGEATATLRSDRRNVDAKVKAVLAVDVTKADSVTVTFTGVTLTASATPRSIRSNGKDTSYVLAVLKDAAGNPIPGEPVNFTAQKSAVTTILAADAATNSRGEARCKVVGTGTGSDTLTVMAAHATANPVVYYSADMLTIDTLPGQSLLANGLDSTWIVVTYLAGDSSAISNATVQVSVTLGNLGVVFAKSGVTDASGHVRFKIGNPTFANTATIAAQATTPSEITTGTMSLYFRANNVYHIHLSVTPSVIGTNGGQATITAVAYDSLHNRVADALVAFNLLKGPGGGEHLSPPTAITGQDGTATSSILAGTIPSLFQEVEVVAGDFTGIKSDTVKMTIAGPPHSITVGVNILKGVNPNDGTFQLPCAAVVTDINGNPVADGTPVTFSCKVTGLFTYWLGAKWFTDAEGHYGGVVDTFWGVLPFEDLNDNFKCDPGEDVNNDGVCSRGLDRNGDGIYEPGPSFWDINHNGLRDTLPEPIWNDTVKTVDSSGHVTSMTITQRFVDLNGNGKLDLIEPITDPAYWNLTWAQYKAMRDTAQGGFGFDYQFSFDQPADPQAAVSITRTVQTQAGKAINMITYSQSDADRLQIGLWAESQGVVTENPTSVILPVIQ